VDTRRDETPRADETPPVDETHVSDAAVFAIERVPRARAPRAVGVIAVVIAALAVAGIVGNRIQPTRPAAPVDDRALVLGDAIVPASARATPDLARAWTGVKTGDDIVQSSAAPLLALDAQASGGMLFIHGDVYTRGAMLVVVSVSDDDYHTLDVRSLNMPGGSTAFRTGPNDRFSLAIQLDDAPSRQPAWVRVDAYDHYGGMIASARASVEPAT
jgi:hypothetical protein